MPFGLNQRKKILLNKKERQKALFFMINRFKIILISF